MKKCILIFLLLFTIHPSLSQSHEIKSSQKNKLVSELISERKIYDLCIGNAEKIEHANAKLKAEKKCRKQYALKRVFTVDELFHFYTEHLFLAEEIYLNLLVGIEGKVHRMGKTALGFTEVVFAVDAFGLTGVRCEFPHGAAEQVAKLKIGDSIKIAGIVKGLFNDDYVRITHCEFL